MSTSKPDTGRRRLLAGALTAPLVAPLAGLIGLREAAADEMPKLSLDDPQAKGLSYVHDASEAADNAAYKEGSHCANCQHWQGGDAEWGGCAIFPGKRVHRNGWCTAWTKQA